MDSVDLQEIKMVLNEDDDQDEDDDDEEDDDELRGKGKARRLIACHFVLDVPTSVFVCVPLKNIERVWLVLRRRFNSTVFDRFGGGL